MTPDNWVIISIKLRIGSQLTGYNSGKTEKKKSGFYSVLMVVTVEV